MPPELFQVVPGRGPAGAALIDAGIDYCGLHTGSTATGKKVAAACGERLIPCALELRRPRRRPSSAADADIDRTARALTWGALRPTRARSASASSASYATSRLHDELVEKIIAEGQQAAARPTTPAR